MAFVTLNDVTLHYRLTVGTGTPIVFLNSLGTDFRIWDGVISNLSRQPPILCADKRGHGLSDDGPINMDVLVQDVAALLDYLGLRSALICGVSVGGMIAQQLAIVRPDLVAGQVLCCTGTKIGDASSWNARIDTIEEKGIASISDAILERWFSKTFRTERLAEIAGYKNMLTRTSPAGYTGVCAAIRDTDLTRQSQLIKVPTHCIAGKADLSTPPEMVEALSKLIKNATYQDFEDCGHLPPIEHPKATAHAIDTLHEALR